MLVDWFVPFLVAGATPPRASVLHTCCGMRAANCPLVSFVLRPGRSGRSRPPSATGRGPASEARVTSVPSPAMSV